jgi:pimeloyl-ACP methyl ester carboxylesterase
MGVPRRRDAQLLHIASGKVYTISTPSGLRAVYIAEGDSGVFVVTRQGFLGLAQLDAEQAREFATTEIPLSANITEGLIHVSDHHPQPNIEQERHFWSAIGQAAANGPHARRIIRSSTVLGQDLVLTSADETGALLTTVNDVEIANFLNPFLNEFYVVRDDRGTYLWVDSGQASPFVNGGLEWLPATQLTWFEGENGERIATARDFMDDPEVLFSLRSDSEISAQVRRNERGGLTYTIGRSGAGQPFRVECEPELEAYRRVQSYGQHDSYELIEPMNRGSIVAVRLVGGPGQDPILLDLDRIDGRLVQRGVSLIRPRYAGSSGASWAEWSQFRSGPLHAIDDDMAALSNEIRRLAVLRGECRVLIVADSFGAFAAQSLLNHLGGCVSAVALIAPWGAYRDPSEWALSPSRSGWGLSVEERQYIEGLRQRQSILFGEEFGANSPLFQSSWRNCERGPRLLLMFGTGDRKSRAEDFEECLGSDRAHQLIVEAADHGLVGTREHEIEQVLSFLLPGGPGADVRQ